MRARPYRPDDLLQATTTLARAFMSYPPTDWMVQAEDHYERLFLMMRTYLVEGTPEEVETWITDDGLAVAVWATPNHRHFSAETFGRMARELAVACGNRVQHAIDAQASARRLHPEEPHYYLRLLGTQPAAQRRGLASLAMRPVLDRCDEHRLPAYTETGTIENVAFYRGLGFEVVEEFDAPDGGPHIWTIWRDPQ